MIYYDVVKRSSWPYIIYYYWTVLYFALKLSSAQYEFPSPTNPSSYSQHGSRTYMIIELNDRDESFHYMCCESYLPWLIWSAHTPRGWLGRELVGRHTTTQNMILFIRSRFSVNILIFASRIKTHRSTVIITKITVIWLHRHEYISASVDHLENETLTVCTH